jgi:hypothetical protein
LVSANWFPKKERILSTSIGAYANIFGIGIGCFVPAIFFKDDDEYHPEAAKIHVY